MSSAAPDGHGGAFFAWDDQRNGGFDIYVQRMMPDGTIAPGWPVNGARAGAGVHPVLAPDGEGGVFLAWEAGTAIIAAQHMTVNGTIAPGWPSDGVIVRDATCLYPSLMADGTGGMIVAWRDYRRGGLARDSTFDIYAQRLTATGTIAPGWATKGLLLAPNAWTPIVRPDPNGGFYLISGTPSVSAAGEQRYTVLRFTMDGTAFAGWPAGGVLVCNPSAGDRQNINAVGDGFGGLLMDWYDDRSGRYDIYASRVLPTGTLAPGFPANGLRISSPSIAVEDLEPDGEIAADGEGGAYLVWSTSQNIGYPAYVQHITGLGAIASGWPQYGLRVASTCVQAEPQIVPDGAGGAVVAWHELDGICSRLGVYAQRYLIDGVVATELSLVSADTGVDGVTLVWQGAGARYVTATVYRRMEVGAWKSLGAPVLDAPDRLRFVDPSVTPGARYAYRLGYTEGGIERFTSETWVDVPALSLALEGLRPNPATGPLSVSFALPDASPASLEVLDVSGRRLAAREVGSMGAGSHIVRLDEGRSFAPGIYWLRLRQGTRSLLARGAVVR